MNKEMIKNDNPKQLLETEVINHLLNNNEYFDIVFPLLEPDFFDYEYRVLYKHIENHFQKYARPPQLKELVISFKDSPDREKNVIRSKLSEFKSYEPMEMDFLLDQTEMFIKRKIFEKAIITGAEALGKNDQDKFTESFKLAEESVKVTLDADLGIFFDDIDVLDFEVYQGILTNIPSFDKVLQTGFTKGTLNSVMAPSGIGKTATLIAFACQFARQKEDIVFISLEQSEEEIFKRIYANLLKIDINEIPRISKEALKQKVHDLTPHIGQIVVKQFPARGTSALGISNFLEKLKTEKDIKEPIVIVDYLGLLKSDFMKNFDNSYAYIGSIAEELRALAIERELIIFSPMQLNRNAYSNLEAGSETIGDSMKVLHTLDFAMLILQTPEMKESGTVKIVVTKNRYSGITTSFEIKFDYTHFKFIDKFFIDGENITEMTASADDLNKLDDKLRELMI